MVIAPEEDKDHALMPLKIAVTGARERGRESSCILISSRSQVTRIVDDCIQYILCMYMLVLQCICLSTLNEPLRISNVIGFDILGIRFNLFDIYGMYVSVDQKVLVLSVNCDGLLYAKMTFYES